MLSKLQLEKIYFDQLIQYSDILFGKETVPLWYRMKDAVVTQAHFVTVLKICALPDTTEQRQNQLAAYVNETILKKSGVPSRTEHASSGRFFDERATESREATFGSSRSFSPTGNSDAA